MNNEQIIKDCFKDLTFEEEGHIYKVNGERLKLSVSGIIKKFEEQVNFKEIARKTDIRDGLEPGTTQKKWDKTRDEACDMGTQVHKFAEDHAQGRISEASLPQEKAAIKFLAELPDHIIPVFFELEMYHLEYMFGGTKDLCLYNTKTGKYIVGDYKTNKDIFKNYNGKMLLQPFSFLLDNPFNHYQIQFSLYQILFEQTGFEIEKRVLIWLRPDETYEMYEAEDYTSILKEYLKNNKL